MNIEKQDKFDYELTVISYRIELKMVSTLYQKLQPDSVLAGMQGINLYMRESYKYRTLVNNINTAISTWEQQLYDFRLKHIDSNKTNNYYQEMNKDFLEAFPQTDSILEEIEEYRHLVNVLKHGISTKSYGKLVDKDSKFIKPSNNYTYLKNTPSFNIPILNISDDSISDLCELLEEFWITVQKYV